MGLFSKKNKKGDNSDTVDVPSDAKNDPKKKTDKSFKPRAPRSMGLKMAGRIVFWIFVGFILIKGIVSFAQGTRVIEKVTNIGSDKPAISDSVKGFAADFATEYFTWTINNVNDRVDRIGKFINGIDQDAGLKPYDVKGSSRVLSVEVYNTNKIDDSHYDITVVVRREIQMEPAPGSSTTSSTAANAIESHIVKKTYMVVPVTVTAKGPLVQSYPRFVAEQQKGESDYSTNGESITDVEMIKRGTELADSFLRSYFDGNISQLKYFYADNATAPTAITKSAFTIDKVDKVNIYQVDEVSGTQSYLRIEASVIVKSDIGESFTNMWILNTIDKEGRLYVLSIGEPEKVPAPLNQESTILNGSDGQQTPEPASTTTTQTSNQ